MAADRDADDGEDAGLSDFETIARLPDRRRAAILDRLGPEGARWLQADWSCRARPAQRPPDGDWPIWLVMAGRGFGKTRMGAEWVRAVAEADGGASIALVGASLHEARSVMVEGESGLLAVAPHWARPDWRPALRLLRWPNGAHARIFGAAEPETLRGPQHSHGWADEIGKWADGMRAWDNLVLGVRLGDQPRIVATTTPRPVPLVRRLLDDPRVAVTRGRTRDNRGALPAGFIEEMERRYAGTRLARQELDGEMIEDVEGALWSWSLLEQCRWSGAAPERATLRRVVIGVDPPAGDSGDACGIVVVASVGNDEALVLEDATVERVSPERWARAVAEAAARWQVDRVVAEANNGGAMVASVLRAAQCALPLRLVHASRGKVARAEPVAALYEAGRVRHLAAFGLLEQQLCGLTVGGGYEGPGRSPDRADALVWALSELMLGPGGQARMRRL